MAIGTRKEGRRFLPVCESQGPPRRFMREYVLSKWKRQCSYCCATGIPLQVEHIVPKSRGGSDRVSNLTLACEPCNRRKGTQTASEFGFPAIQAQARVPLKDVAHVSSLKTAVV